ncbi:UNVERIFIED_CONTAM: hypothetical protein H355_009800 [Colinus virginianus]|nr:hypothetical protein H355_009800 [Colinus virginianus]
MVHPVEVLYCPNMVIEKTNICKTTTLSVTSDHRNYIMLTPESFATGTVTSFKSDSHHYAAPASSPSAIPVSSVFQSVSRSTASSVAVQPLSRPVNVSGTSQTLQRPVAGCLSTQQMTQSSSGISQPSSRPVPIPVTTQPVSRNITVPVVAQPVSRPVPTVTAQPVILDQDYIMDSAPDAPDNTSGILFGVRQNSGVAQYQTEPTVNVTGGYNCSS